MLRTNEQSSVQLEPECGQPLKNILSRLNANDQEFFRLYQLLYSERIYKGLFNTGHKTHDKLEKIWKESSNEVKEIILKFKFMKINKKTHNGNNITEQQVLNDLNSPKSLETKLNSIIDFETDDIKSIGYDGDNYFFTLRLNSQNLYVFSKLYKKTDNGWEISDKVQTAKFQRTAKYLQPASNSNVDGKLHVCSRGQNEDQLLEVSNAPVFNDFWPC